MRLDAMRSTDSGVQNRAYQELMKETSEPVAWAYEVWDELLADLKHKDNHVRAIASQLLCNLAKSDPEGRIVKDLKKLVEVTRDERFVTARHCLQSLWKIGMAGEKQRAAVVKALEGRYKDCADEKNGTLIRFDIVSGLRRLFDAVGDESIRTKALKLIETEEDLKYRKKYAGVWKAK